MTTSELRRLFNNEFGLQEWPLTYEVDHETYANVCQSIFEHQTESNSLYWSSIEDGEKKPDIHVIGVSIGLANGIMFKNVELILKKRDKPDITSSTIRNNETWNDCPKCGLAWKDKISTLGVIHRTRLCDNCIMGTGRSQGSRDDRKSE